MGWILAGGAVAFVILARIAYIDANGIGRWHLRYRCFNCGHTEHHYKLTLCPCCGSESLEKIVEKGRMGFWGWIDYDEKKEFK